MKKNTIKKIQKTVIPIFLCILFAILSISSLYAVEPISSIWNMKQPEDGTYYLNLKGTAIGSDGSKDDRGAEKAFDNVTQTYFESLLDEPGQWCGLKFDTPYIITEIRFFPRLGNPGKLVGGSFEVSTDGENWISVFDITEAPGIDFSKIQVLYPHPVSYVRYINNSIRGNIAEIEIYGCTSEEGRTNETVLSIIEATRPNIHTLSALDTIDILVVVLVLAAICGAGLVFIKKLTTTSPGERQI